MENWYWVLTDTGKWHWLLTEMEKYRVLTEMWTWSEIGEWYILFLSKNDLKCAINILLNIESSIRK